MQLKVLASIQACKTRTILTTEEAIEIFRIYLSNNRKPSKAGATASAAKVAAAFKVNEKTIRDIWSGRTWIRELMHLDPARACSRQRLSSPNEHWHRRSPCLCVSDGRA